jgi:CBS domain-containing protein
MRTSLYKQQVKDVMSKAVVVAPADATVHDALILMEENAVTVLPVLDFRGRCIGILSSTDVLEVTRELEDELGDLDQLSDNTRLGLIDLASRHSIGQRNIGELMSESVATVNPESKLTEAAQIMLSEHVHHLPVVDEQQKLVGIMSTMDILRAFVDGSSE